MKLDLALVSALAATASAFPVRIISLSSPPQYLPADSIHLETPHRDVQGNHSPCHGAHPPSTAFALPRVPSDPIGALLARLGLAPAPPSHHGHGSDTPSDERWQVVSALHEQEAAHRMIDGWKHHIEESLLRPAGEEVDRILPLMQGGSIKILPIMDETGAFDSRVGDRQRYHSEHKHDHAGWKSLEGSNGVKKHSHHPHGHGYHSYKHEAKSFFCRLGRALRSLTPTEATALMFVLGAGLGSLLHLVFAMLFLSIRVLRGKRGTCAERRAARREARRARKEERKAKKAGALRLEGPEGLAGSGEEVLPSYEEEEGDRLVEKA